MHRRWHSGNRTKRNLSGGRCIWQHRLHEMNDIDLLVRKNQVVAVTATLSTLGYPPRTQDSLIVMHLPRFIKPDTAEEEIHWAINQARQTL